MKKVSFVVILGIAAAMTGCSSMKKDNQSGAKSDEVAQTTNRDEEATSKAQDMTTGWPDSATVAAKEMVSKYGDPDEKTSESLIWRNVAPFKRIVVHKTVYNHRFPLLHQNALEHVVDYKAPENKVGEVWKYNGSIVLDRTKGEMSSFAENEAMNILALNLADDIMRGRTHFSTARINFGKETIKHLNGEKTANTTVLKFGTQIQTADQGESVANKIRWVGDRSNQSPRNNINTRQAQEEK